MIKIECKFNASAVQKAVMKAAAQNIVKCLESVRCAEHGKHPRVTVTGSNASNLKFAVKGCCQALVDAALAKLNKK